MKTEYPLLSQPFAQNLAAKSTRAFAKPNQGAQVLHFSGHEVQKAGKNGLWITVERVPARVGGLGEVSKTIPEALNKHLGKDVRVLVPMLKPMKDEGGFVDTGIVKKLKDANGREETFKLFEKYEEASKTWVYAIDNPKFNQHANLYFSKDSPVVGYGEDAMFRAIMLFNRAAAAFTPEIGERFGSPVDFVMVHDWLTSPFLSQLPEDFQPSKIFMLHNTYNEPRPVGVARQNRLKLPEYTRKTYSPLLIGHREADVIIANGNYARTIALTDYARTSDYAAALRGKIRKNRVVDMHHGLAADFNPQSCPALKDHGFTELRDPAEPGEISRFKQQNKAALQKLLGLNVDSEAVIFTWAARFEPYQKGFYMLMYEMEDFLRRHPKVQLVVAGENKSDPQVNAFVENMNKIPEFKGRLYLPNQFVSREAVIRMNAGSDFTVLPSLYEPYGLTQLEAKMLGSIPVVHGVDGLRSTVSDPLLNGIDVAGDKTGPTEKVWEYGQTGILMQPLSVMKYFKALDWLKAVLNTQMLRGKPQTPAEKSAKTKARHKHQKTLDEAQAKFKDAIERALVLAQSPEKKLQTIQNGMRYVKEAHPWPTIVARYDQAIDMAMAVRDERLKTQKKQARFSGQSWTRLA
ncbi:MAG: glycogen/starch synthase [Cyanobacteria bacterium]|nr:glycogen/starch synthase [Cyanobacteriota bacterium]